MAHRLWDCGVPRNEENYTEERNKILKLGSENGYGRQKHTNQTRKESPQKI
jgi:hypothetical protein